MYITVYKNYHQVQVSLKRLIKAVFQCSNYRMYGCSILFFVTSTQLVHFSFVIDLYQMSHCCRISQQRTADIAVRIGVLNTNQWLQRWDIEVRHCGRGDCFTSHITSLCDQTFWLLYDKGHGKMLAVRRQTLLQCESTSS